MANRGEQSCVRPRGASVRLTSIVAVIAACLVLLGFVGVYRASAVDDPPLRIAINPWPGYEFATLAQQKGFFADEGVRVELLELSSLGDSRRAYERRQVDGFFATLVEVIVAEENGGRSPRVALVADWSDGADVIIAGKGMTRVSDLRGRRVGVESDSLNAIVLARAMERHGLELGDVVVVPCAQLNMRAAMELGELDAVVTYPPISTSIDALPDTQVVFTTRESPNEIVDVLAVDADVIGSRPEAIAGFRRAFFRAQEYAKEHPAEAIAIMAARQRISPAEFEAALNDGIKLVGHTEQDRFLGPGGSLRETARRTRDSMVAIGMLRDPLPKADVTVVIGE
jgi:NitT/TauT family transport system substrate-binding protein